MTTKETYSQIDPELKLNNLQIENYDFSFNSNNSNNSNLFNIIERNKQKLKKFKESFKLRKKSQSFTNSDETAEENHENNIEKPKKNYLDKSRSTTSENEQLKIQL